jgi:citrate synthase
MTTQLHAKAGIAHLGSQVVVHGKDLHHECRELGFVHYLLFCVCGRTFDPSIVQVLEESWVSTGYPDARIWCNRIAGYLGSARVDPGLSMSAAIAASNSLAYGFRALSLGYRLQAELPSDPQTRSRWLEQALAQRRVLHGYGRPQHGHDERIAVALDSLARAGLRAGPQLKRAFWLHAALVREKSIEMNIAAVWAALAIDFGIARHEYEQFMLLMFAPGYAAVYADQRSRGAFAFLAGHQSRTEDGAA